MTIAEVVAVLTVISDRIEGAFDEDADRYAADKHMALEEVGDQVADLLERLTSDSEGAAS